MNISIMPLFVLWLPVCALAQDNEPVRPPAGENQPEEVVVVGQRHTFQLRMQLMEAEENAYDIFNSFNDEARFDISCDYHASTGSRLKAQVCMPNFEIQALRAHASDYLESYRLFLDPLQADKNTVVTSQPMEATIASQQEAYRRKMRQVAGEHPEFLEALIKYSEIKSEYEAANSMAAE